MRHRDRYSYTSADSPSGRSWEPDDRVDEGTAFFRHLEGYPQGGDHFSQALRDRYADGYFNGYVLVTRPHEDGECEQFAPGEEGDKPSAPLKRSEVSFGLQADDA
jgi:hypothetical protein